VSDWIVVMHTYLCYISLSLSPRLAAVVSGADSIGHGGHVPPLLQLAGHGAP